MAQFQDQILQVGDRVQTRKGRKGRVLHAYREWDGQMVFVRLDGDEKAARYRSEDLRKEGVR
jgi:hypothetical protein